MNTCSAEGLQVLGAHWELCESLRQRGTAGRHCSGPSGQGLQRCSCTGVGISAPFEEDLLHPKVLSCTEASRRRVVRELFCSVGSMPSVSWNLGCLLGGKEVGVRNIYHLEPKIRAVKESQAVLFSLCHLCKGQVHAGARWLLLGWHHPPSVVLSVLRMGQSV